MENKIEKLKNFIKSNPPNGEEWYSKDWTEKLNETIPDWKELLKSLEVWDEIRKSRPKRNFDEFLNAILIYAPPTILKSYLESDDPEERKCAFNILIKDNAKKLTTSLWNSLEEDTRIWLISKIQEIISDDFLKYVEMLKYKYRYKIGKYYPDFLKLIIDLVISYEKMLKHPLWIKLNATISKANDKFSLTKIKEIDDNKIFYKIIIDQLIPWQKNVWTPASKNILLDPSLLLDFDKARMILNFMREHREFNFYIPKSFIDAIHNYDLKYFRFFDSEFSESKLKNLRNIENLLMEFKKYYTVFDIFEIKRSHKRIYRNFHIKLRKYLYDKEEFDDFLINTILEEWVFLQYYSIIASKIKKVFEIFKELGAISIELSKEAYDKFVKWFDKNKLIEKIARKELDKDKSDNITIIDKLRGLAKFIAIPLVELIFHVNPLLFYLSIILDILDNNVFTIIDP